jgi:hypothetical protein
MRGRSTLGTWRVGKKTVRVCVCVCQKRGIFLSGLLSNMCSSRHRIGLTNASSPNTSRTSPISSASPASSRPSPSDKSTRPSLGGENCRSFTPPSAKILAVCVSTMYPWLYTTSAMPTCVILTLHVRHGHVLQYSVDVAPMRSRPASSSAFSSACRQRHVERSTPPFAAVLQRGPSGWSVESGKGGRGPHIRRRCSSSCRGASRCSLYL